MAQADEAYCLGPGTKTTGQDFPGRVGYWEVGVPPNGPFDACSFRLGKREHYELDDAVEISHLGGWRQYLESKLAE